MSDEGRVMPVEVAFEATPQRITPSEGKGALGRRWGKLDWARIAETLKQPSFHLRQGAPRFYPTTLGAPEDL